MNPTQRYTHNDTNYVFVIIITFMHNAIHYPSHLYFSFGYIMRHCSFVLNQLTRCVFYLFINNLFFWECISLLLAPNPKYYYWKRESIWFSLTAIILRFHDRWLSLSILVLLFWTLIIANIKKKEIKGNVSQSFPCVKI